MKHLDALKKVSQKAKEYVDENIITSYNDLSNRPFYDDRKTITFDGNIEGKEIINLMEKEVEGSTACLVKISNEVEDISKYLEAVMVMYTEESVNGESDIQTGAFDVMLEQSSNAPTLYFPTDNVALSFVLVVLEDTTIESSDDGIGGSVNSLTKGVYFLYIGRTDENGDGMKICALSFTYGNGFRRIDEKYVSCKPGMNVEGKTLNYKESEDPKEEIASYGAEIFNDLINNVAIGAYSHAEGSTTYAKGDVSHAEGYMTEAYGDNQHVQGKFNIRDTEGKYAHIVGNGRGVASRSNAHTLDWDGNSEYAGDVVAYACGGKNPISLKELHDSSLSKNQGVENSGKYLTVGEDGNVTLVDSIGALLTEDDANTLIQEVFG